MAFGIPGSNEGASGSNGLYLARIQYDARSGFFTRVNRVQRESGWEDDPQEPSRGVKFAMDFGSMEAGYIKFAKPPAFVLVPYLGAATAWPQQPTEMTEAKQGEKSKKAFQPGIRIKVMSQATFGDPEPRYFAHTAKGVLDTMDALYQEFIRAPEAAAGKVPLVHHVSTKTIETSGPKGTTKNYAPVWAIVGWIDRPAGFGDRTVPPPSGGVRGVAREVAEVREIPGVKTATAPVPELAEAARRAAEELEEPLPF